MRDDRKRKRKAEKHRGYFDDKGRQISVSRSRKELHELRHVLLALTHPRHWGSINDASGRVRSYVWMHDGSSQFVFGKILGAMTHNPSPADALYRGVEIIERALRMQHRCRRCVEESILESGDTSGEIEASKRDGTMPPHDATCPLYTELGW